MNMKLSDDLKYWRSERPDEWIMDRFIKKAEELEKKIDEDKPITIKVNNRTLIWNKYTNRYEKQSEV